MTTSPETEWLQNRASEIVRERDFLKVELASKDARIRELEPLEHSFETMLEAKCAEVSKRLIDRALRAEAQLLMLINNGNKTRQDLIDKLIIYVADGCSYQQAYDFVDECLSAPNARILELEAERDELQRRLTAALGREGRDDIRPRVSQEASAIARIRGLEAERDAARKWNQDLLDAARETGPDANRRAADWGIRAALSAAHTEIEGLKSVITWLDERSQTYEHDTHVLRTDLAETVAVIGTERDSLRAQLATAREALGPFASAADAAERNGYADKLELILRRDGQWLGHAGFQFADLRKARAALAQISGGAAANDWICSQCGEWHSDHQRPHTESTEVSPSVPVHPGK